MSSLKDMRKSDLSVYLKANGVSGISRLNKDELLKLAKKVNRKNTQRGGKETSGATFLPAQWYNPSAKLPSSQTDMMTAYGMANPVSGSCRNLAAFPKSSGQQTGGKETSGATFLPSRWFNPKADLANPATDMMTAYGMANPVSGSCRNFAAFPKSSGQQTGGKKKNCKHTGNCKCQKGGQETSGATPLPSRWYNPNTPLANSKTDMMTAYGMANPVSGSCRNLAAFPKSSGQQTGGKKNKK
jgi:hypothetical protein